ncbi:MAG: type II toxin-antitoxin system HicA family toxin [Candidatus Odinarchaeia archaeon]
MPKLRKISGELVIKILCNKFNFKVTGKKGSHVRLSKATSKGRIGTVVPLHKELKIGTLMRIVNYPHAYAWSFLL